MNAIRWFWSLFYKSDLPELVPASKKQYNQFLKGYTKFGGEISHHYSRSFNTSDIWIATKDFDVPILYGASSKVIIVPEHVRARYGYTELQVITSEQQFMDVLEGNDEDLPTVKRPAIGHNTIMFMDNFTVLGHWIPAYEDTVGYDVDKA